jgi:hypothetical protein
MTLREIVYMIMDELKILPDDSSFNEDHIKFLVDKYRALVLKQAYEGGDFDSISESNFQTIKLSLMQSNAIEALDNSKMYLKSKEEIPSNIFPGIYKIFTEDYNNYKISIIPTERFKYTGFSKWTKNIIYGAVINNYLYLKSNNPQFIYLEDIYYKGIFEGCNTDDLDAEYPLEANLVPAVIQSVVQEVLPRVSLIGDNLNDATDGRPGVAAQVLASANK